MDTVVPRDDPNNETEAQIQLRITSQLATSENVEEPFAQDEILQAIKNTKPKKAAGPDNLKPEIFINYSEDNMSALLNIINLCWRHEYFPKAWKKPN